MQLCMECKLVCLGHNSFQENQQRAPKKNGEQKRQKQTHTERMLRHANVQADRMMSTKRARQTVTMENRIELIFHERSETENHYC